MATSGHSGNRGSADLPAERVVNGSTARDPAVERLLL
jgi:hypothetical protein